MRCKIYNLYITLKIIKQQFLHSLQVLSLGGNLLTEVPSTVGQLKILHALVLCDNQIEKIPAEIANLQYLKSLLLHKNRLKTLPQEILTLKNLTEVLFFWRNLYTHFQYFSYILVKFTRESFGSSICDNYDTSSGNLTGVGSEER